MVIITNKILQQSKKYSLFFSKFSGFTSSNSGISGGKNDIYIILL